MKETPVEALVRAAELAGGQSALAAELTKRSNKTVSSARVWNWINRDGGAPPEHCAQIEDVVERKVTRKQLRPDDWMTIWPELVAQKGARAVAAEKVA